MDSKKEVLAELAKLEKQLTKAFGDTYSAALRIAEVRKAIEEGATFTWKGNPGASKKLDQQLTQLSQQTQVIIKNGVTTAWTKGETNVSNALYSVFGKTGARKKAVKAVGEQAREDIRKRGADSHAFYTRKQGGLTISQRVWNITGSAKQELETIIQNGVLEGKSADEISRGVKGYLSQPNRLFRSVRNKKTGQMELSAAAKQYHPGAGVYRSSYKNAMRLVRTEVNAAYRRAEWESYQSNPLIVGYRIELSNNHTTKVKGKERPLHDICDEMQGQYPKTFVWTGWHPQCRCRMIPVTISDKDFSERIKALAAGALKDWKPSNTITEMPEGYTKWIEANKERIANGQSTPFWIRDNYKGANIEKGLNDTIAGLEEEVKKQAQPITEFDGQIAMLRRWAKALGGDLTEIDILRLGTNREALKEAVEDEETIMMARQDSWTDEMNALYSIITNDLKNYPDLQRKYKAIYDANGCKTTNVFTSSIPKLKAAKIAAIDDLAKEKAKESKTVSKNMPSELAKGSRWLRGDDYEFSKDFFDLIDPAKPVPVTIHDRNKGAYYSPAEARVHIDYGKRTEASPWDRKAVVYHEFGHSIDWQRGLRFSTEVAELRMNQISRLKVMVKDRQETTNVTYENGKWVSSTTTKEVTVSKAKAISDRLDRIYRKIRSMKEETFTKRGITKADVIEQICSVQDTLKSLVPSVGWGHSNAYFKNAGLKEAEYLAHCFENTFIGNRVFQKYLPKEYAEMIAYIKSLK